MKIAQIDVVYGEGSTGKIVEDIHTRLLAAGHDSRSYYGRGQPSSDNRIIKISPTFEVYLDALASRVTGYTGTHSPIATKKLISYLEDFKPDVVHLHEIHGYFVNYFELIEYLIYKKIPIVCTLHSEYMYTGRCGYAFDCNQWKSSCFKCPTLNNYPKSQFFDRSESQFNQKKILFNKIEKLILAPVSKWLSDRVSQSFLKGKQSIIVHNGIDTNKVFVQRNPIDLKIKHKIGNKKVILSVAPDIMSERKGGNFVLEIARRLNNSSALFIMIGVSATPKNIPNNVICLPAIKDSIELSKYYSLADIFLITSSRETFSLTCAESLACGTPIIGFDSGGPSEVAPNPYGHFVQYGRTEELTSLLMAAINSSLQLASRTDCIKFARSKYSNERMFLDYLKLYKSML